MRAPDELLCLEWVKKKKIAKSAAAAIAAETANLASIQNKDGDEDPFLDCDELEEDETVIEDD